jgi:peptide/nickel transport system ATP-binding protein
MTEPLLAIDDLKTWFFTDRGVAKAVDGVSLSLAPGETLAVVGESGCGKTVLALSILGLVQPPGRVVGGGVLFEGRNLAALPEKDLRKVRGAKISMIFQEPMTSLNPVLTVGEQVAEAIRLHRGKSRREALELAGDMLRQVGIPDPVRRLTSYPHELSGGMRQRVMIAMALSLSPSLLIADEPTTALDVTIQKQILELMLSLTKAKGASIIFITHNLGVVAETCENAAVMYSGKVVEYASVRDLFREPLHPYTRGLIGSLPKIGHEGEALTPIPGIVPALIDLPEGCHFRPRCPKAFDKCLQTPPLFERGGRAVRCWLREA